ncbi:hypothetical protein [Tomitella cavernea]|uniref:Uncharacterized protein n=1 Tax=Tomitella cavernea TaxID=1387982 RepID=A0ABP9CLY7_9ACTN|nr:hypothetical protein [Tomitella cavernea]
MDDSGPHHGVRAAGPVPTPAEPAAPVADPDAVREQVHALLERADRDGAADPAALYEQAHEVLLEALSTLDRN